MTTTPSNAAAAGNVSNITRGSFGSVLAHPQPAVMFDPDNKTHRTAFAKFLDEGRWAQGSLRFQVEWPHTSAITTIQTKLTHYALRKELAKIEADKALEVPDTAELVA